MHAYRHVLDTHVHIHTVECTKTFAPCRNCFVRVHVSLSIVKCLRILEVHHKALANIWS